MDLTITRTGNAGPDVVLVHGWAMHGGIFGGLVDALAARCRVHVVDLPGHGRTPAFASGDLDPARCAAAIAAATPPAIWVGWSLGGLVAMHGALAHAGHVRGLVAIAASPRFVTADDWPHGVPASVFAGFAAGLEANFQHAIERFLALETLGSPHAQDELRALRARVFEHGDPSREALREGLDILDREDVRARLPGLAVPSCWIAGRRDRLVPPAAMQWAAEASPRGRFVELPTGHAPFLSEADAVAVQVFAVIDEAAAA